MDAEQFASQLAAAQTALKNYVNDVWPNKAGAMALRFIDGNFRAQGWQGKGFLRWKPNQTKTTILIRRGFLRRQNRMKAGKAEVRLYNNSKYAKVHNEGFKGTVNVKEHTRRNFTAKRMETGRVTKTGKKQMKTVHIIKSVSTVKAHTMRMNIDKRQFMPTSADDSPVLANALKRDIERTIKDIFK